MDNRPPLRKGESAGRLQLTFRTSCRGRGYFGAPTSLPCSSGPGLPGKDGGLEAEGFEPLEWDRIRWTVEPSLRADSPCRNFGGLHLIALGYAHPWIEEDFFTFQEP